MCRISCDKRWRDVPRQEPNHTDGLETIGPAVETLEERDVDLQLNGKAMLINGGSKGIGFCTALCFAGQGANAYAAA